MVSNGSEQKRTLYCELMTSRSSGRAIVVVTLRLCLVYVCACVGLCDIAGGTLPVAIFAPVTCGDSAMYARTIQGALDDSRTQLTQRGLNLSHHVYDTCDEVSTITSIIEITQTRSYGVIIGPGHVALCDISARLAHRYEMALVSWRCTDNVLQNRDTYSTFSRSTHRTSDVSNALVHTLNHFQWKYVALISLNTEPYITLANDIHLTLNKHNFEMKLFREMTSDPSDIDIISAFSIIPDNVKGQYSYLYIVS